MKYSIALLVFISSYATAHSVIESPAYQQILQNVTVAPGGGWADVKREANETTCPYRASYERVYGNLPGMAFCYWNGGPEAALDRMNEVMQNLPKSIY